MEAMKILTSKMPLSDSEYLRFAIFVYNHGQRDEALPYFILFAENTSPADPNLQRIMVELESDGLPQWAELMRDAQARKAQ